MNHPASKAYALAAFRASKNWGTFLAKLAQIATHDKFVTLNKNPATPKHILIAVVEKIISMDKKQQAFVSILVKKNRLLIAPAIYKQYTSLINIANNTSIVHIATACHKTTQEKRSIESYAQSQLPNLEKIQYHYQINPQLIAGFTLHHLDTFIDCSLQGQFNNLQHAIAGS